MWARTTERAHTSSGTLLCECTSRHVRDQGVPAQAPSCPCCPREFKTSGFPLLSYSPALVCPHIFPDSSLLPILSPKLSTPHRSSNSCRGFESLIPPFRPARYPAVRTRDLPGNHLGLSLSILLLLPFFTFFTFFPLLPLIHIITRLQYISSPFTYLQIHILEAWNPWSTQPAQNRSHSSSICEWMLLCTWNSTGQAQPYSPPEHTEAC